MNEHLRILFEQSDRKFHQAILKEITKIENEAQRMTAEKMNSLDIQKYFQERTDELKARVAAGKIELVREYKGILDEMKQKYLAELEKNPSLELARFNRDKAQIDAASDSELAGIATDFITGKNEDLSPNQINLIAARLRDKPDFEVEFSSLRQAAKENHANEPWLRSPEARTLEREIETLESIGGAEIALPMEGETSDKVLTVSVAELIDTDLVLNKVVAE